MSRKSGGPSVQWSSIVLSWVNLFEQDSLSKISSIKSSNFFIDTITTIYKFNGIEEISFNNSDDLVMKFIKEYFPEIIKEKRFNLKNEDDILVLVSLLMYTTCVKCKIDDFVAKTCTIKLNDNHEEAMKTFFELMLTVEEGHFNRRNIMNTVQQCFEPVAVCSARKSLSPSVQRNCLKEFLGSPILQERYKKNKEDNDVRHLNALLQEENSELVLEKEQLSKNNQELELTVKKLQSLLNEKTQVIATMKEELGQCSNTEIQDGENTKTEKLFSNEINQIKIELEQLHLENENLLQDNVKYKKQITDLETELKEREVYIVENLKTISQINQKLEIVEDSKISLENEVKELKQIIEQYHEEKLPKEELDMSTPRVEENLGQILTDIELKEKEEIINQLKTQLKSLELLCEEKVESIKQYETNEKKFQDELQLKCLDIERLQDELQSKCLAVEKFQDQLQSKCLDLEKLKGELQTTCLSVENLQSELRSKCLEVENVNDVNNGLLTQIKLKEGELGSMTTKMEELTANNRGLEDRIMKCFVEYNEVTEHLRESHRIVDKLNITVTEKDTQICQLNSAIQASLDERKELQSNISLQAKQIRQFEISEKKLQDELQLKCLEAENAALAYNDLKNQVKVSEDELQSLTNQVKKLTTTNEILENDLIARLKESTELEEQLTDSLKNVAKLNSTIAEKEFQIDQMKTLIQTLSEEQKECQLKIEHQAKQIRQLEISEKKLQDELQLKFLEAENATAAFNDLKNQVKVSESELKSLTNQVKKLTTKNEILENNLTASLTENKEFEEQLADSLKNVAHLNSTIAEKEFQIDQMKTLIQTLSEEQKECQLKNAHQNGEIKQLEISKKDLENKLKVKCCELDDLTHVSSGLQQQVNDLLSKNLTLEEEVSSVRTKIQELKEQLMGSNHQFSSEIKEKDSQLAQLQAAIQTLEMEKKNMAMQFEEQKSNEIKNFEVTKTDLEIKLKVKCSEMEDLIHTSTDLEQKIKDLSDKNATLVEELSLVSTKMQEVEEQLTQSQQQLTCEIAEKDSQLTQLQAVIDKLQVEKEEMETQNINQSNEIKHLEIVKTDVESRLKLKCSELEDLIHTTTDFEQKISDLSTKNTTLAEELSLVSTKMQEVEEQLSQSQQLLTCKIAEKSSQLAYLQAVMDQFQVEKEEFETERVNQTARILHLEGSTNDLEDKLQLRSSEFEEITRTCSELKQQIGDLSAKNTTLTEELLMASTQRQEVEEQLSKSNQLFTRQIAEKDSQLAQLQAAIDKLQVEKEDFRTETVNLGNRITHLETNTKDLESKLQLKSSEFEELTLNCSELEQRIGDLSAKNTTLTEELLMASAQRKEVEEQLSRSNEQFTCEIAEKDSQLAQLQTLVQKLETEKKDIQNYIEVQSNTVKQLEASKKDLENNLHLKSSEFEEITRTCSELEQQITDLSAENATWAEKLLIASAKMQEYEEQISLANQQFSREITEKETQLHEVIQNLEMSKREMETQYEDQVKTLKAKIAEDEIKVESLEAESVVLNKEVVHVNSLLSSLQSEFNDISVKNNELSSQLSSVTAGAAHLENIIQEDNYKIDLLERTVKKLESAAHDQNELIAKLKEEVSDLEKASNESKKLVTEKETDMENLQIQLNIKTVEIGTLREEVEKLIIEKEGLVNIFKRVEEEKIENQKALEVMENENQRIKNELKEYVDKLTSVEQELLAEKNQIAIISTELDKQRDKLEKASETCEKIMEENQSVKKQLENYDPQLKEAHDKLFNDYHRVIGEYEELKVQLENVRTTVRAEYEEILKKMKSHMKSTCTRALEAKDEKHAKELKGLQEVVKANQDHISQLSTNLWDTSDKLLITRNENEELKKTVMELKKMLSLHQSAPDGLQRTRSHDQLSLHSQRGLRMVEEETVTVSRRQSVRTVPSGIGIKLLPSGKVFPSEDEAEEMFSNECLADLKAGRCQVSAADPDRVSTLMYRNSLCPPHLKSSYPAETQFLPADTLHEDDIKGRGIGDDVKLLRRKDRSQAMELRNVSTPRSALREMNDENRKPGTPSRLFSHIFSARPRKTETEATPDRRRLSFFGKARVKKEPTE